MNRPHKRHPALRPAWVDYVEIAAGLSTYLIVLFTIVFGSAWSVQSGSLFKLIGFFVNG